jgi:kynureninase
MEMLDDAGIVVDKRKPDVIRVAPMPLYNTYEDVWNFVQIFKAALAKCE